MKHGQDRALTWLLWTPALVPLVCPRPPFQDWPAHLGVIGALVHMDDPAARISEFYEFTGWVKPNVFFYAAAWLLAHVVPPLVAANLLLALALGGLAPAVRVLCRAAGADERLSVLALPLALGRIVYCGFIPNAAALVFSMLAFAAYLELARAPTWRRAGWLFLALFMVLGLHAFIFLSVAGLILILIAIDLIRPPRRGAVLGLLALAASTIGMAPYVVRAGERAVGGPGLVEAIWSATLAADRSRLEVELWEWLFASYRYAKMDDVLQWIWVALLAAGLLHALAVERGRLLRGARGRLILLATVTLIMFAVLPSYIGPPVNWWGGNLRLPSLAALLLLPAAGPSGRVTSEVLPWLARRVCTLTVGLALFDLGRYGATEMKGFGALIQKIPPGKRLSLLHYTPHHVHEYPGEPHGYSSNYYLLERGGYVPQNVFEHPDVPFRRKYDAPAPPWGIAYSFTWSPYGAPYEVFLTRAHDTDEDAPFVGADRQKVDLEEVAGPWRYWTPR